MPVKNSLIELPRKGKALIVTDIHGNFTDYNKYLNIRKEFKDEANNNNNHFILTGDYIHGMFNTEDNSIEILNSVMWHYEHTRNFHVLLGNHEWSHISGQAVYKAGTNQKREFEQHLHHKFGSRWERQLNIYIEFFKGLPLAVRTKNGVFISHAAPSKGIESIEDIIRIKEKGYGMDNGILFELLWNRYPGDYDTRDIKDFLDKVGSNVSVVGHTPVNGYVVIGSQIVLSSSFSQGKKCYMELDLENDIRDVKVLIEMIRYLE